MRQFIAILLSVLVGFGPIMPQLAYANPIGSKKEKVRHIVEEDFNEFETNSFHVVELGDEEKSLKVLYANVVDRGEPKKTLKNVKRRIEEAYAEHPNLRFVNITVHPKVLGTDDNGDEELESVSHFFRLADSYQKVGKQIGNVGEMANALGTSKKGMFSYEHINADFNVDQQSHVTSKIMEYSDDRNPYPSESVSFLKALTRSDIDDLNFRRPRTDIATAAIRGFATFFGVAFAAYMGGDATAVQASAAAALPATIAAVAGLRNQDLLDWEQHAEVGKMARWMTKGLKNKTKERAHKVIKEIKRWRKHSTLALFYVASLQTSMQAIDKLMGSNMMPEPMVLETFLLGIGMGTVRNLYKKTALLRSLNTWVHEKYKTNPKSAKKYARIHAWTMAIIGSVVTASDSLQALDSDVYPLAQDFARYIDGTMIAAGLGGYLYLFRSQVFNAFKKTKSACSDLFSPNKEKRD